MQQKPQEVVFFFFNPKHRVMRNSKETFLNIFLLLTAWLRFVLYDNYLFFFFALLFSTTSERCHLWTYNSSKNGKDEGHENYNSHFCEQQFIVNKESWYYFAGAGGALEKTRSLSYNDHKNLEDIFVIFNSHCSYLTYSLVYLKWAQNTYIRLQLGKSHLTKSLLYNKLLNISCVLFNTLQKVKNRMEYGYRVGVGMLVVYCHDCEKLIRS